MARPGSDRRAPARAAAGRGGRVGYLLAQLLLVAIFLFPLLWVVSLSLKTADETLASPPSLLPVSAQWSNYAHVVATTPIGRYLLNSLVLVLASVAGSIALSLPAAYVLSRHVFRGRRAVSRTILAAQLVSPLVVSVPLYQLFVALGAVNNPVGLVLVYVALIAPFTTWFLKTYLDTVPRSLDEAALIDGCSRFGVLCRIIVPSVGPGIASAAILGGVTAWSQFVIPYVLLDRTSLFPVSVGVVNLQSTAGEITTQYLAAGAVMAVAPVVVLFVALQRFIVGALTAGAVKA